VPSWTQKVVRRPPLTPWQPQRAFGILPLDASRVHDLRLDNAGAAVPRGGRAATGL